MKRWTIMLMGLFLLGFVAGCKTTPGSDREPASGGYLQDQATRQTERDAADTDKKKTKRPIDTHRQERQDVIDQPR